MSATFHVYDARTGIFTGVSFGTISTSSADIAELIAINTPRGYAAYAGYVTDPRSQRVDVASGTLVDYQSPQPSADHEWNALQKRWQLNTAAQARQIARIAALAQIAALERKQLRPLRELALGVPGARERLAALDMQIQALRAGL